MLNKYFIKKLKKVSLIKSQYIIKYNKKNINSIIYYYLI